VSSSLVPSAGAGSSFWVRFPFLFVAVVLLSWSVRAQEPAEHGSTPGSLALKPQAPEPSDEEEEEEAAKELKQEEHQRILGVLPNFNTITGQDAARLNPKQKVELATKSVVDPVTFAVAALDGAWSQGQNNFPEYGQGLAGYGKRFGAAYADNFSSTMIGNAFLPILFKQDPRYFRKGSGSFSGRLLYAVSTTVRAKNDDGRWVPNYANVLGNFAAGGISNLYYPPSDRGLELTVQRALIVTAEGSIGALFVEFWPDVAARYKRRHASAHH
jgi:hypothetical protein